MGRKPCLGSMCLLWLLWKIPFKMEQSTYLYGKKPSDKGGSALKL